MNELWCLHVIGPDDVMAAPSKEAAEQQAESLSRYWKNRKPHLVSFEAMPWPHSPESHAASLPEWDAELSLTRSPAKERDAQ